MGLEKGFETPTAPNAIEPEILAKENKLKYYSIESGDSQVLKELVLHCFRVQHWIIPRSS